MNWTVKHYVSARGESVINSFIKSQDRATQSKIIRMIDLIKKHGPDLGLPRARYLGDKLYELRIRGRIDIRIFYVASNKNNSVVLVHAFKKKSQKIPGRELKTARLRQKTLTGI